MISNLYPLQTSNSGTSPMVSGSKIPGQNHGSCTVMGLARAGINYVPHDLVERYMTENAHLTEKLLKVERASNTDHAALEKAQRELDSARETVRKTKQELTRASKSLR